MLERMLRTSTSSVRVAGMHEKTSRVVHTCTDTQSFEHIKYTNIRLNDAKNTHDLHNYMY